MDFVAKILIDQQDIAGRMSRGGEHCEIDLFNATDQAFPWNICFGCGVIIQEGNEPNDYQNLGWDNKLLEMKRQSL